MYVSCSEKLLKSPYGLPGSFIRIGPGKGFCRHIAGISNLIESLCNFGNRGMPHTHRPPVAVCKMYMPDEAAYLTDRFRNGFFLNIHVKQISQKFNIAGIKS